MSDPANHDTSPDAPARWTLRDLSLSARVTIAVFLISVGCGYFSAIVQLHFQHAEPGSPLPTPKDAVRIFHGHTGADPVSHLEMLLMADESKPFTGQGQMVAAFTKRASGNWKREVEKRAKASRRGMPVDDKALAQAEKALRAERMGERDALVAWVRAGADEEAYNDNKFCLPEELQKSPLTPDYAGEDDQGHFAKIKDILAERCVRCHQPLEDGAEDQKAAQFPLHTFKLLSKYTVVKKAQPMSLEKLAQTTHVHLLAFSILYFLTGILLALTPLPGYIRLPLAPLPLLAQVVDISFWWLARIEGPTGVAFAEAIPLTGMIVGASLGLQIFLVLFSMFRIWGWLILLALLSAATYGGFVLKEKVIMPFLESTKPVKVEQA